MSLTIGELCAGYGGLALAVEQVFNARLAWVSEYSPAPASILAHHWPTVPNHGDLTGIDWSTVEPVDIVSGGTPCQDLSTAGRRAGMAEGTRSNLWAQMRESIATIQPRYVVWENVRGAYSAGANSCVEQCPGCMGDTGAGEYAMRALGRVLGDLSDLGYDCQWRGLRAADVGAPHARFRVFILATHRDHLGRQRPGPPRGWRHGPAHSGFPASPAAGWGKYAAAVHRWEPVVGRAAPAPAEVTAQGGRRLSASFAEWMMGLPAGWITAVPGIDRGAAIRAAGNGVVPQQAAAALADMLAHPGR